MHYKALQSVSKIVKGSIREYMRRIHTDGTGYTPDTRGYANGYAVNTHGYTQVRTGVRKYRVGLLQTGGFTLKQIQLSHGFSTQNFDSDRPDTLSGQRVARPDVRFRPRSTRYHACRKSARAPRPISRAYQR